MLARIIRLAKQSPQKPPETRHHKRCTDCYNADAIRLRQMFQMTDSPYQLNRPNLQWEDGNPVSTDFDDVYFSRESGLEETRHVFLRGNQLAQRFRALPHTSSGVFTIAETGFGTGLNLLAAMQLWRQLAPAGWRLQLLSTELYPLDRQQLATALAAWPELKTEAAMLLSHYPERLPGYHWRWLEPGRISLGLWFGDAAEGLDALLDSADADLAAQGPRVDAWFLDGFAPARNPGMWQPRLFQSIRRWSHAGTRFATFTAAGHVRRGLAAEGFTVSKVPGFGSKREMLAGELPPAAPMPNDQPVSPADYWASPPRPGTSANAVVIGAGLAGSATALALARRGWQVTVLDAADQVAAGASGNPQGVLYTRLSANPNPLSDFALISYLHALSHYRSLRDSGLLAPRQADFCGVLQLPGNARQAGQQQAIAEAFAHLPELVQYLTPEAASEKAGLTISAPGLWFPQAGWLSPAAVCRAQLNHSGIELRLGCEVIGLQREGGDWQLQLRDGSTLESPLVIAATGTRQDWLSPWFQAPVRPIRGQISHLPQAPQTRCVVCHEGYVTPAVEGGLWIGATFDQDDETAMQREEDHRRNRDSLATILPELVTGPTGAGRVGFRATTPDYLPIAGPVPVQPDFDNCYAALASNARRPVRSAPPLWPGLLVNCGHGSRGLTSTPLCGEWIAALASGELRPLPRALATIIHPARFAIRQCIKGNRG